jgi:uncharacterized membrane-anchored protein
MSKTELADKFDKFELKYKEWYTKLSKSTDIKDAQAIAKQMEESLTGYSGDLAKVKEFIRKYQDIVPQVKTMFDKLRELGSDLK